jgi:DNA-binding PadR family transcriptional regulator
MSTRHAILTILNLRADSGYGLAYRSGALVAPLWSATHSQIYAALRQLLDEGLVRGERKSNGTRREATIYRLTPAGLRELRRWQVSPIKYLPRQDPFRFRLAYIDELPLDVVETMIDRHVRRNEKLRAQLLEQAAAFRDGTNKAFEERHASLSRSELKKLRKARVAIYEELACAAQFEIESAERLRQAARDLQSRPARGRTPAAPRQKRSAAP